MNDSLLLLRPLLVLTEERDPWLYGHGVRVSRYSCLIADAMGISREDKASLKNAALLHDIGMLAIGDDILHSARELTNESRKQVEKHPELGARALEGLPGMCEVASAILHHHEHYNGQGYPRGLKGLAIPVPARVIHIAEAIDAMLHGRSYKPPSKADEVIRELQRSVVNGQFDPEMVKAVVAHPGLLDVDGEKAGADEMTFPDIGSYRRVEQPKQTFSLTAGIKCRCQNINEPNKKIDLSIDELGISYLVGKVKNVFDQYYLSTKITFDVQCVLSLPSVGYFEGVVVTLRGNLRYSGNGHICQISFFEKQQGESAVTRFLYAKQIKERVQ